MNHFQRLAGFQVTPILDITPHKDHCGMPGPLVGTVFSLQITPWCTWDAVIYETDLHEGYTLHIEGEIIHGLFRCELEGAVPRRRGEESEVVKSCSSNPAITDGPSV